MNTKNNREIDEADSCVISHSHFLFGQAMNVSDSLASGLNLYFLAHTRAAGLKSNMHVKYLHIQVQHTSFVSNKGQFGNLFFVSHVSLNFMEVDVVIKNLSVVSDSNFPGLVMHDYGTFVGRSSIVNISIVECMLVGSCVVILGDSKSDDHTFEIVSMDINKSRCPVAVNITDMNIYTKNINISDSHGDILQATNGLLKYESNVNFYRNQGAFSVTRGYIQGAV